MSKNRISDPFPEDQGFQQPVSDLGPLMEAINEAFDKLTPDEQIAFLQQAEECRLRQKRQKIADMESQFIVDHGLTTFRKYLKSTEIGHEIINVIIVGADGAKHKIQGPQCMIKTLPEDECFTQWPKVLYIVNDDGSSQEIKRLDDEAVSE